MKASAATDSYLPKPHNWLFKLTFSFIFGILFAHFADFIDLILPALIGVILALTWYFFFKFYKGVSAFFLFFFSGVILYMLEAKKVSENMAIYTGDYSIKIERILKQKDNTIHLKALVYDSVGNPLFRSVIYGRKDSLISNILPGDYIVCNIVLRPLEDTKIPYAFSQKKYYRNKGISHFAFLNSRNIYLVEKSNQFNLYRIAYQVNKKVVRAIQRWPGNTSEKEVLIALLTGTKDFLSEDIRLTYADTGIIHVLAVSGLHTGLIYVLLSGLFYFFIGNRFRVIKAIVVIASLWFYAVYTGLTPSVVRAATMFSFIQVGSSLKRKTGIYHSLCISALLLLASSPFLLFDIGFQLSYSAVFGIVTISRFLNSIFVFSDALILKKIGELISVSVAAQLFTMPFTLFYFSKFPTYFFIANIFAIPLVSLTLYLGFPLAIVSSFTDYFDFLGVIPSILIRFNNYLAHSIQTLPYSSIRNIYISEYQFIVLFAAVVFLSLSVVLRKKMYLYSGLISVIILQLFSVKHYSNLHEGKFEISLYVVNNQPLLAVHNGRGVMSIFHPNGEAAKQRYSFYISKYLNSRNIGESTVRWKPLYRDFDIILANGRKVNIQFPKKYLSKHSPKDKTPDGTEDQVPGLLVRISNGEEELLNRDGDRIFIR